MGFLGKKKKEEMEQPPQPTEEKDFGGHNQQDEQVSNDAAVNNAPQPQQNDRALREPIKMHLTFNVRTVLHYQDLIEFQKYVLDNYGVQAFEGMKPEPL